MEKKIAYAIYQIGAAQKAQTEAVTIHNEQPKHATEIKEQLKTVAKQAYDREQAAYAKYTELRKIQKDQRRAANQEKRLEQ